MYFACNGVRLPVEVSNYSGLGHFVDCDLPRIRGMVSESRKYDCKQCQKGFGKAEHLRRHEGTHTGSRPHTCVQCNRGFARQDALLRHQKRYAHGGLHPSSTSQLLSPVTEGSTPSNKNGPDHYRHSARQINTAIDGIFRAAEATSSSHIGIDMPTETPPFTHDDHFFQLTWPDSENLLQSILSSEFSAFSPMDIFPSQPKVRSGAAPEDQAVSPWLASIQTSAQGHGCNSAVQDLSQIITSASADVTVKAQMTGFTTVFLDGCLHMFFTRVISTFPVVHAPTFVFKDWTHPLLLNAIALGSLFMGQNDDITKGEILWRLAHTAVTTSWHDLINHRGPYDGCCGVQLVMTALLGQLYAILSRNDTLRKTAQIFHSLGFYWSRQSRLYDIDQNVINVPALNAAPEEKLRAWKLWAARETQLRALLGHYILDGLIAQNAGSPTCQRHASNPLPLASNDTLYQAGTADDWIVQMETSRACTLTFRDYFNQLFSDSAVPQSWTSDPSVFSDRVILEGLNSLVLERNDSPLETVGIPSKHAISRALGCFFGLMSSKEALRTNEHLEALLRWHFISLDAATDCGLLCRTMCETHQVSQTILGARRPASTFHLATWARTPGARRALLHAIAIEDTLQQLPIGRANALHVPSSIFAAAMIYCGFLLAGISSTATPSVLDWTKLMVTDALGDSTANVDAEMQAFLEGNASPHGSKIRNLFYDAKRLSTMLQNFSRPWGVSTAMQQVLEQLLALCG